MLRDITIGQHFPGSSLVHKFDPRLKLVLTIAYIILFSLLLSNPEEICLTEIFPSLQSCSPSFIVLAEIFIYFLIPVPSKYRYCSRS